MFRPAAFVVFFSIQLVVTLSALAESTDTVLADIARLLPGTYTNDVQLATARGEAEAFALTTIIKPLNNPVLGETLYYLEEFRDNDPQEITRIRIYSFTTEESGVRLRLLNPTDIKSLQGAHTDLGRAERLTLDDVQLDRENCMLDMTRHNDALVARMRHHACDLGDIWMDYELIIDQAGTWTCYARRAQSDDRLTWLQMPAFPCIRQQRLAVSAP